MRFSRFSLRPIKLSDVDDFLKWTGDDRVTRYLRWDAIASSEESLTHTEKVAMPHPWYWIVCLDDRLFGCVVVKPHLGEDRCQGHISYAVGADYCGQGTSKVAMRMAISLAFKELSDLARLETLVEVENIGSQKVLEKIGFLKEGLLRSTDIAKVKSEICSFIVSYQRIRFSDLMV